jgi:UTP-glucose-1-phosphate uridylyltransferase
VTISAKRLERDDIQSRAHLVRDQTFVDGVFSFRRYIEKPQEGEITEPYGVIGRYVMSPDIFEIIESLVLQDSLLEERDSGRLFNLLLKRRLGLGVESNPHSKLYDAGTRDIYYASLIEFLVLEDRTIRNVLSRVASKERITPE